MTREVLFRTSTMNLGPLKEIDSELNLMSDGWFEFKWLLRLSGKLSIVKGLLAFVEDDAILLEESDFK